MTRRRALPVKSDQLCLLLLMKLRLRTERPCRGLPVGPTATTARTPRVDADMSDLRARTHDARLPAPRRLSIVGPDAVVEGPP